MKGERRMAKALMKVVSNPYFLLSPFAFLLSFDPFPTCEYAQLEV